MGRLTIYLILVLLALGAAGAGALLTADMPAPTERVEKVLPDDRFPR
jgi:hypothetical protein